MPDGAPPLVKRSSSSDGTMLPPSGSFRSGHAMRPVQPPGNGSMSDRSRGPVPPASRKGSFRDAASKVTLSESIRNNGKVLEEHQTKIQQQARDLEDARDQLCKRDSEMQAFAIEMNERLDAKKREADDLREKERASEMAIRRLEEDIRLLRKQHNEIDKHWRRSEEKSFREPASREKEGGNKPPVEMQRTESFGTELKSLKRQLSATEAELAQVMAKLETSQTECEKLKKLSEKPDNSAAYKEQMSKLSASLKDAQGKLEKKDADAESLKAQLAAARKQIEALQASMGKCNDEDASSRAQLEKAMADANMELSRVSTELDEAKKAKDAKEKADKEADEAVMLLAACKKEKAVVESELAEASRQVQELKKHVASLGKALTASEGLVVELRAKVDSLEGGFGSAAAELEKECERMREVIEEKEAQLGGKDATIAANMEKIKAGEEAREREKVDSREKIAGLENDIANLRDQLRTRGDSDKESLARLCRIRELEEQLRKGVADAAEMAGQRDSARSEARSAKELRDRAVQDLALEKAKFDGERRAWLSREAVLKTETDALSSTLNKGSTKPTVKEEELEHLRKKLETQTSMHRLQMLLRMAEVTKLEEHIKCQRRTDNVKEEKIGLLTYNLASAESQISGESEEAAKKRQDVRTERMSALNKRQKTEEDKMRTNEESYNTQSKKLKEKLAERERDFKALK